MNTQVLKKMGAHFLSGHFDCPSEQPMSKYAAGLHQALVHAPLSIESGHALAPTGRLIEGPWAPILNGIVPTPPDQPEDLAPGLSAFRGYWQAYDVEVVVRETLDAEGQRLYAVNGRDRYQYLFSTWQGHATLDYAAILRLGLPGYKDRIRRGLEGAHRAGTTDQIELFDALTTVMSGIEVLVKRYASACGERAALAQGQDLCRLGRLEGAFREFLAGPPRDFFGALHLVHFMNALDGYDNVGRLDQYLYPFYRADIDRGMLAPDQAEDLLVEALDIWGKNGHWQVVIGGTDREGQDAANELTLLILRARGKVKRPKPSVSVRLPGKSSSALMDAALDLLGKGFGQPAFYNEELYRHALGQIGVPTESASEFVLGGCSETHIAGKSAARDAFFNLTKALEAVFYNGRVSFEGGPFGLQTGPLEDLRTFEDFLRAYKKQVAYLVEVFVRYRNHVQQVVARLQPALMRSIFISGCLDSGLSHSAGGAEYNYGMMDVYGIPNVANALFAVRTLVYEERCVSLSELVEALRLNFEGHSGLRDRCLRLPKYGNGDEGVDALAADVADHVFSLVLEQWLVVGDGYYAFCASAPGAHVMFGKTTGATPDGRLSGTPLANSIGPMQGTDRMGPTAMLQSVSGLPLWKCVGSPVVTLSLSPSFLSAGDRGAVAALIRTFFRLGGMQIQVSLVDRDTLEDAMKHPEAHPSLMVRVSGYSERFTRLSPELQGEILSRTVYAAGA
ncbi:MAG: pyruvate formate lyase family protein [Candidatus Latescibacterota bacterium]